MRYLFARVAHNDHGWTRPSSGRLGSKADGGYVHDNGFAFEDWNFSGETARDGNVYGYLTYVPKDPTGPFGIAFATYDSLDGWSLVGFYHRAEFDREGSSFRTDVISRRAVQLRSLANANSLGAWHADQTDAQLAATLKDSADMWRWRVAPADVHPLRTPIRLPASLTQGFGKYFSRASGMTEAQWNTIARIARSAVDKPRQDDYADGGLVEFPEGKTYQRTHTARERSKTLVAKAKARFVAKHGRLFCEACDFDFEKTFGRAGIGFIEAHHILAVSELPPGAKTRFEDLAMVCSNCHRILHRRRPWLSIKGLRMVLKEASKLSD